MASSAEIRKELLEAVDTIVSQRISGLELDKTIVATIDSVVSTGTVTGYKVRYNGGFFIAYSQANTSYAVNTKVYVQVPQNNFSNTKTIIGAASDYHSDYNLPVVSSIINDYMPIEKNLLSFSSEKYNADTEFGLNSYLGKDAVLLYDREQNIEDNKFSINIEQLQTYLEQAEAIMIEADFRTSLSQDQQQQSKAEYGLVFEVSYKNVDSVYSTQGEMFDALADTPVLKQSNADDIGYMRNFQQQIEAALGDEETSSLTQLQIELTRLEGKINNFIISNKSVLTKSQNNIFSAYCNLILNLGTGIYEQKEEIIKEYNEWFAAPLVENEGIEVHDISTTKTIVYNLNSSVMVGDPFRYTSYTSQYSIFPIDIENFESINKIYFYCNGFKNDPVKANYVAKIFNKNGTTDNPDGKDIWVKDIQFLALRKISDEYGDYKIKIKYPNGLNFKSMSPTEILTISGEVIYKEYTDISGDCSFYWFKKDARVNSVQHSNYNLYGGKGWYFLGSNSSSMNFAASSNKAWKNDYMCVAVYPNAEEGSLTLKVPFTLINDTCKVRTSIVSDLGVRFKFDAGTPTLTCLLDGKEEFFSELDINKSDDLYIFKWSKIDKQGNIFSFENTYEELEEKLKDVTDYSERLSIKTEMAHLKGVKYPKKKDEPIFELPEKNIGNKLVYPVQNIMNQSQVTFECQVYTYDIREDGTPIDINDPYLIGKSELTILNEGMANVNDYTVVIENGDQVFQYSESGVAPTFESGLTPTDFRHTEPLEILPIKAHLYNPNGLEVSEGLYTVRWVYPISDTLIKTTDILQLNPADGRINLIKGQSTNFTIEDNYDYNALDNQIQCIIEYGKQTYIKNTNFFFTKIGDNGTNGTDIVAKIEVNTEDDKVKQILTEQPLSVYINTSEKQYKWNIKENIGGTVQLKMLLYNRSTLIEDSDIVYNWKILGNTAKTKHLVINSDNGTISINFNEWDARTDYNQIIQCAAHYNEQTFYCNYPVVVVEGTRDIWNDSNKLYIDNKFYLKQILYSAAGRTPIYNKNQGVKINNLSKRYIEWSVSGDAKLKLCKEKNLEEGLDNIGEYGLDQIYIQAPNQYNGESCNNNVIIKAYNCEVSSLEEYNIEYENLQEQYKKDTELYNENIQKYSSNLANQEKQVLQKYETDHEKITKEYQTDSEQLQIKLKELNQWYKDKQDDLQDSYKTNIENNEKWYKGAENVKGVIEQYKEDLNNLYSTYFEIENEIYFYIPIYMTLNTYSLASFNSWDGNSIDINDQNGHIMAPQIGAGKKEEDDNSFTGIVMGNLTAYGSDKEEIGLQGFSKGRRSIFLDATTGKAVFGLPKDSIFGWKGTNDYGKDEDDYTEGLIELNPGGTSSIGGWQIGRRSLFYATDEQGKILTELPIGKNNHEKDIGPTDTGILLAANNLFKTNKGTAQNPNWVSTLRNNPYLSIKGRPLVVKTPSNPHLEGFDIDNSEGNSPLVDGDSLELNFNPSEISVFTIFRHFKQNNVWDKEPLVGIDAQGRFYSNTLRDKNASLNMNWVSGFGRTAADKIYLGLNVEYNETSFFKTFMKKEGSEKTNTLYISGGAPWSTDNRQGEYRRPISLHGNTINLFAWDNSSNNNDKGNADKPTTNSKITISSSGFYAGNNPNHYISIPNSKNELQLMHNEGAGKINIGDDLTITANGGTISNPSGFTVVTGNRWYLEGNAESTLKTTNGAININAKGNFNVKARESQNEITLTDTNSKIGTGTSYLLLENSNESKLNLGSSLHIDAGNKIWLTSKSNDGIDLQAHQEDGSIGSYISIKPQKNNQINIHTYSNAYIQHEQNLWDNEQGWKINPGLATGYVWLSGGPDNLIFKNSGNEDDSGYYDDFFSSAEQTIEGSAIYGVKEEEQKWSGSQTYYMHYDTDDSHKITAKQFWTQCLWAAADGYAYADAINNKLNALIDHLGSAAYANTDAFRASDWLPSLEEIKAVSTETYEKHRHYIGYNELKTSEAGGTPEHSHGYYGLHFAEDDAYTSTPR